MLLPQQLAVWRRGRLLVERTEVSEEPITTYRTSTFGIALLVNDSPVFTALWTSASLLCAPAAATAWAGGRYAEQFLQALLPVLFLDFVILHTFCVSEDPASLLTDWRESVPPKLLSRSSSMCSDLPDSSRTRARRARKFFKISALPNFSPNRGQMRKNDW